MELVGDYLLKEIERERELDPLIQIPILIILFNNLN